MKKRLKLIRLLIMPIAMLLVFVYYTSNFSIEPANIEEGIAKALKVDSVEVLDTYEIIEGNPKDIITYFKTSESYGVVLLHLGLNDKYLINDLYEANEELACVHFLVNRVGKLVFYGYSEHEVETVSLLSEDNKGTARVFNKEIFFVKPGMSYNGPVELGYIDHKFGVKRMTIDFVQGSSWKGIIVASVSILILLIGFIALSFTSKRYRSYNFVEYNGLQKDGQRLFQYWHK